MKITVLGCGGSAGVPMLGGVEGALTGLWGRCDPQNPRNRRTRSSIVIEGDEPYYPETMDGAGDGGFRLLVDSGPDFRSQMLDHGLSRIDAVLFTHPHSDHTSGLDELRSINRVLKAALPLYARQDVLDELKQRFEYAFTPWTGPGYFRPVFDEHLVHAGDTLSLPGLQAQLFEQRHGKITTVGMRLGDFAYCTDVETLSEEALAVLAGVDTWLVDCFQYKEHPAHGWLERVLEWRERIGARRTVLTHMGPEMDYATLCRDLPQGVEPAYDGMVITL
nr:MBL fold metallo-hydrolase [uncultured Neokomagataea sp.]